MRYIFIIIFSFYYLSLTSQIQFGDVVLDSYYSGVNPNFSSFYGNNGLTDGCRVFLVPFSAILGDNDSIMALPTGSFVTIGFTDNLIFDAEGQDDLFIEENGGGQEFGDLYVSPDGVDFTFLDIINGAQVNSFDLADYPYDDVVKAIKIVGNDNGGCVQGLDIERVYGLEGANCPCGADLATFPDNICSAIDTSIFLDSLVLDTSNGIWIGPEVLDNVFNPQGLTRDTEVLQLEYLVNVGHAICPVDTINYEVSFVPCDCGDVPNGTAIMDQCGQCLQPEDPMFNEVCRDCSGVINGPAIIDSCGLCLPPSDDLFNRTCLDCNGDINGLAIIDLCGNCFEEDDPLFNENCPERFRVYVPNIFDVNSQGLDNSFGLFSTPDNLGTIEFFNIYDKWGTLVFSIRNQKVNEVTRWWDGTFEGKDLNSGAYTYRYIIDYPEIGQEEDIGTVILIR